MSFKLECVKCKSTFPFDIKLNTCPHHNKHYGYLQIIYDSKKYKPLPVKNTFVDENTFGDKSIIVNKNTFVDLGQVITPIIKINNFSKKYGLKNIYVKDEGKNPTGSFKDRENFIFFNYLLEHNIKESIYIISSGNAAISTTAYAKLAGLKCSCYLPTKTSSSKKEAIKFHLGEVLEEDVSYETIYNNLVINPPSGINATPGVCPLKEEGDKMIAYEIIEQIGLPDKVFVPCGNGTLLWSIFKGFKEIKDAGRIIKLPQMIGVQIEGGDPLKHALNKGEDYVILEDAPDSLAEGIIATESYSSPKTMIAIKSSEGTIISVSEQEIIKAHQEITDLEEILPEITSSVVYAALKKVSINNEELVICINTGCKIKDRLINNLK